MTKNTAKPPRKGRQFYAMQERADGAVDVYLKPRVYPLTTPEGATDYDVCVLVVRGVVPYKGLENDIRARYSAWCESAEEIWL